MILEKALNFRIDPKYIINTGVVVSVDNDYATRIEWSVIFCGYNKNGIVQYIDID